MLAVLGQGERAVLAHCPRVTCNAVAVALGPTGWHSTGGRGREHFILLDKGRFATCFQRPANISGAGGRHGSKRRRDGGKSGRGRSKRSKHAAVVGGARGSAA
jgi:hypothetical protein